MEALVIGRMGSLVDRWRAEGDGRADFLECYRMMTRNMMTAVEAREFRDCPWVERLLNRFADYYFVSLDSYDRTPDGCPPVWKIAHDAGRNHEVTTLRRLLLGVNAHINYDLVFTVRDLLRDDWQEFTENQRALRREDHGAVNTVIARTVDAVQDGILEPGNTALAVLDDILGPVDEYLVSRLITGWRDRVWDTAVMLVEEKDPARRALVAQGVRDGALRTAEVILTGRRASG